MTEKVMPIEDEVINLQLDRHCNGYSIAGSVYTRKALGLKYHRSIERRMSEADFDTVLGAHAENILIEYYSKHSRIAIFSYASSTVCSISYYVGEGYNVAIASDSKADAEALEKKLVKKLPIITGDDNRIPLTFWTLGAHGPRDRHRKIVVPTWSDIGGNYPSEVGDSLTKLTQMRPGHSGQLIMFHGVPGTGKSYAIRALLREWHKWCKADYIIDPEKFFGSSAEYMISVLLGGSDEEPVERSRGDNDEPKTPWRLYIVEDGDEFLTVDAKARSGQALSRLLNVVDGMIGQGLQILVLVTTNEPLEGIHPAIIRPGRCLANIEFRKFNKQEGRLWLNGDGGNIEVADEHSLAELYHKRGEIESLQLEADKIPIGFA